jgi:hypothetical protein
MSAGSVDDGRQARLMSWTLCREIFASASPGDETG